MPFIEKEGILKDVLFTSPFKFKLIPARYFRLVPRVIARGIKRIGLEIRYGAALPQIMALTLTELCNLRCTGCYVKQSNSHMSAETAKKFIDFGRQIGTTLYVLTGGEPTLWRHSISDLITENNDVIFQLFTNGQQDLDKIIRSEPDNLGVTVSFHGNREMTDRYRGSGVYDNALKTLAELQRYKILSSTSHVVTRENIDGVINPESIGPMIDYDSKMFLFFPYKGSDSQHMLTAEQRIRLYAWVDKMRETYPNIIFYTNPNKITDICCAIYLGRTITINPDGTFKRCPTLQERIEIRGNDFLGTLIELKTTPRNDLCNEPK